MGALADVVDEVAADGGFAGVVRVEQAGVTEFCEAYGLADRRHGIAMTTESQLAMASGSKAFTALAVMSLVEDGVLDLSTTARSVLGGDLPLIADDVTVEHLLAHRSGIGDYLDEDSDLDLSEYAMPVSVAELETTEQFVAVLDGYPTKFPADERFSYCNGGFVVLALIAERAAGTAYHDLVRERVLTPAGLADTDFLRSDDLPGRAAVGYVEKDGAWRTNVFHLPIVGNGDGGAYTTAADMGRFWSALFEGAIVGREALAQMLEPRSHNESTHSSKSYGLGFWLAGSGDAVIVEGCDAGVSLYSEHDPAARRTWTVLSNTTDGAWPMAEALDAHLAERRS